MKFGFIHAADIHLDSPMLNLARYEDAPVDAFRGATRQALSNLVQLAIEEEARFVLIAGDLYDGDCRDFNTPRWLGAKFEELKTAGIRVLLIQGNHDAQSRMKKAFRLQLPDNVHLFSTKKPETVLLEELGVAVHGQGFALATISDDMSANYPAPRKGYLNIGLLHTNCGSAEGHDNYAPSTVEGLTAKGYDYWALGHIHKRQLIRESGPWIVYPGNIQGRHINEEGRKGCTLVTVDDGRIRAVEHRDLDLVRWMRCNVDAAGCADPNAVLAAVGDAIETILSEADDRSLAVRVRVTGSTEAHFQLASYSEHWQAQLLHDIVDRFNDRVWVEKTEFRTGGAVDLEILAARDDALGELLRGIRDVDSMEAALSEVRSDLDEMFKRLPADPRSDETRVDLDDPDQLQAVLSDIKDILMPRLLQTRVSP